MNDRDQHRRGARAARPLTGRLDYLRERLTQDGVLAFEAARDADGDPKTRWAHAELSHICGDIAVLQQRVRELRSEMMAKGCSPHALAAPIPLVLKRPDPPLMPIEARLADDGPKMLGGVRG